MEVEAVQEASLVRLALNALQGLLSALLSIEKLSAGFCADPADRTYHKILSLWNRSSSTHALGRILKSVGFSGSLVFLLRKFVEHFTNLNFNTCSSKDRAAQNLMNMSREHPPYSLVNQAFAVAVGKVLEGYICALDTLYASVWFRHGSNCSEVISDLLSYDSCLSSVVHSEVTLLSVYLHTKELRTQIEALGNICNLHDIAVGFSMSVPEEMTDQMRLKFAAFYKGGDLLSYLYMQLQVADPAHRALLKFLFLQSIEPYCGFVRSWIFEAEITDPFEEFIIHYPYKAASHFHCEAGILTNLPLANIREAVSIPCFLSDFLVPILRTGQQLQVLKQLLGMFNYAVSGDYSNKEFLPSWSGYITDNLLTSSPINFSKYYLEAMTIRRNSFYRKMEDKTKLLWEKLASLNEQGLSCKDPLLIKSNMDNFSPTISLEFDHVRNVPTSALREASHSNNTEDESLLFEVPESSETSSWSDFDEQEDDKNPTPHPKTSNGVETNFLSLLTFTKIKAVDKAHWKDAQISNDIGSNSPDFFVDKVSSGYLDISSRKGSTFSRASLSLLAKLDDTFDESEPLGWSLDASYDGEISRCYERFHQRKVNVGCLNAAPQCFGNMNYFRDALAEDWCKNQLQNPSCSETILKLHQEKDGYRSNLLSVNPMLRRSVVFHSVCDTGDNCSMANRQLFPCFDFSSVGDPQKLSPKNASAHWTHRVTLPCPLFMAAPDTNGINPDGKKQDFTGENVLIFPSVSSMKLTVSLKEHDQEAEARCIHGGSNWESLLRSFSNTKNNNHVDRKNMSDISEFPLDFVVNKCLLQEISLQYKYVSKLAIELLKEGFDLQGHFSALRRYYFMEVADWADLFIMSLWRHKWDNAESDQRVSEIQRLLGQSIQMSSCEQDPKKELLYVYTKGNDLAPHVASPIGIHSFNFLGLGYRVNWPVSIVLTSNSLEVYAGIFSFLIQVKLAVFALTDVWRSLKDLRRLIIPQNHLGREELGNFNMLIKLRHQLNHFLTALQQYLQSQLSQLSWYQFLHSLKYKVNDMMDLESVLMAYLADSQNKCFQSESLHPVASAIDGILQCAVDFQHNVAAILQNLELYHGDAVSRLSGIITFQVIAIKQKFDANMKELHLCYTRSSKYGDSALARFWECLNDNEFYADILTVFRV